MSIKFVYSMCLKGVWRNIGNNRRLCAPTFFYESSFKRFSSKPKNEARVEIQILLKDETGKIIGVRNKSAAELLANKLKLRLVEEQTTVDQKSKHRVFQLTPISQMLKSDDITDTDADNQESDDKKVKKTEIKRISFSTKFSEHDLRTKIITMKKWLKKDMDVKLTISSNLNEKKLLDALYKRIQSECIGAKFVKNATKDTEVRFIVHSTPEFKEHYVDSSKEHDNDDSNFDNIDPNKLLNEDINELLKDK